jgi:arabinofuranosyltransferase
MFTRFASLFLFGLYLIHVMFFDFLNDDAFISFRYAQNLAVHGELTYNLGERVEGYTNFLWTVLMAGVMYLGGDVTIWSKLFGMGFGIGTIFVCAGFLKTEEDIPWQSLVVAALLVASPAFACWSTGGLETMMFTFFLTLGWTALAREGEFDKPFRSSFYFALSALVRPEGLLAFGLSMLLLGGRWIQRFRTKQNFLRLCLGGLTFLIVYGPYFGWRVWYYGWLFPNTYYVKTGAVGLWTPGLAYVGDWIMTHGLFLLPLCFVPALLKVKQSDRWLKVCAAVFIGVLCIHVAKVGGDFMALHRFLVPVMPIAAILMSLGLGALWRHPRITAVPRVARVGVCVILCFATLSYVKRVDKTAMEVGSIGGVDSIGWLKMFANQCKVAGEWLAENAPENASLATTAAGTIPYFSGLYTVDILGLNDEWIAHEVPPKGNRPGHTRSAPASYLASKAVDYLVYHPQFFPKAQKAAGRTLRDKNGDVVRYNWRIERIPNLTPSYWGFWEKRASR